METVEILRLLWARRALVAGVAVVALLVGFALTFRPSLPPESRQYEVGQTGGRILVDTPDSQVVDIAPKGSETLGARASVLAALMTEGDGKAAIAERAGLAPADLLGFSESVVESQAPGARPPEGPDIHLLTTRVVRDADGIQLPIIEFEVQAPTPAAASELADAAVAGLRDHLDSKAVGEKIADDRRLNVSALGIEPAGLSRRGPGRAAALAAMLFVLLAGCAAIVLVARLSSAWRAAESGADAGTDAGTDVSATEGGGSPAEPFARAAQLPR